MLRTTAILIVTLLTGAPGASLACEFWCDTPAAETHHSAIGCHRVPDAGVAGERVIATAAGCHDAPAVGAFLKEARPPDTRHVTTVSAVQNTPTLLVHRHLIGDGWSVVNGQPQRPPAFRTVLRI